MTRPSTAALTRAEWSGTGTVVPTSSVHSSRALSDAVFQTTVAGGAFSAAGGSARRQPRQAQSRRQPTDRPLRAPANDEGPVRDLANVVGVHIGMTPLHGGASFRSF